MTELVSPCCGKPVTIASEHKPAMVGFDLSEQWISHWYECSACGKPCDPVAKPDVHATTSADHNSVIEMAAEWLEHNAMPEAAQMVRRLLVGEISAADMEWALSVTATVSKDTKDEEKV